MNYHDYEEGMEAEKGRNKEVRETGRDGNFIIGLTCLALAIGCLIFLVMYVR